MLHIKDIIRIKTDRGCGGKIFLVKKVVDGFGWFVVEPTMSPRGVRVWKTRKNEVE